MGEGLARLGFQFGDDFQLVLVDDLHGVLEFLAHHRIGPRIAAVLVAAHEEARAAGGDLLDGLPGLHVDDADDALVEVGRRHHRALPAAGVLPFPADAGAEVRHAGQFEVGDLLAHIEVDHLAADCALRIVARGAHHLVVTLGEVEVVEVVVELAALRIEETGDELAFAILEVVDHAGRNVVGLRVVRNLPHLLDVLERGDEALARRGVVDGGNARGHLAVLVGHRQDLLQVEVSVEDDQAVRQVIGHRHPLAVAGHRRVARVDAGAHLGDDLEIPQVELGDPAVA